MATKNFSTVIPANRTVGEIQGMLAAHGARNVGVEYDAGMPVAITAVLPTPAGDRSFRLAARVDGTQARLVQDWRAGLLPRGKTTREQAARVVWRSLQDWLEATVALAEAGGGTVDEMLFPFMLPPEGDGTIYQAYIRHQGPLLGGGTGNR